MKNIQAIAFDLDGTLIHSLPDLADSANTVRAHFGMPPLEESLIETFIGDGVTHLMHRALTADFNGTDEARIEEALAIHIAYYGEHFTKRTRLYPQVKETLAALQERDIRIALVTNKIERHARKILEHYGIIEYFAVIYGGDTLPVHKPAPDQILGVAKDFNLAPEQVLMVGDSPNDMLSAKAAGSPTLFVSYGYCDNEALINNPATTPDYQIDSFEKLLSLLN